VNPDAAIALMIMGHTADRQLAEVWAQEAARRGATPKALADAWAEWDRREAEDVRVIRVPSW
jgi:hypothetical protein